jgi:F-type H+-transporting ATPase subunit c
MDLILAVVPPAIDAMRTIAQAQTDSSTTFHITDDGIKFIGAGLAMGLGAFGPALGIGNMVGRALDALGRNPEAQPVIQTNMILGLAFAEAIGIYALVTAVMIGFVF